MAFPIAIDHDYCLTDCAEFVAIPKVAFPIAMLAGDGLTPTGIALQSRNTQSGLSHRDELVVKKSGNRNPLSQYPKWPFPSRFRNLRRRNRCRRNVAIPKVAFPIAILLSFVPTLLFAEVAIPKVAFPIAIISADWVTGLWKKSQYPKWPFPSR